MKKENLITVIIFLGMLLMGGILFLLIPDRDFSENENRYLAKSPEFNKEDLISGEYMEAFEEYVSDQFPFRNPLMAVASSYKYLIGMRDINGTYVGSDGYLMNKTEVYQVDDERIAKNLTYINDFFEKYKKRLGQENICFMLVPEASMVMTNKLPYLAEHEWEAELMNNIRGQIKGAAVIEPEKSMSESDRQLYYRTDHHWTTYGAFEAYKEYASYYGRNVDESDYDFVEVSSSFQGTLYSKVLLPNSAKDVIVINTKYSDVTLMADNAAGKLYDLEALEQKDKYEIFLGGNYGIVEIDGSGKGSLLIIKDSFANSFVPFLLEDYDKIIMIDLRYYTGDTDMLIEKENITNILVLYQITNFISDENMIKLGL